MAFSMRSSMGGLASSFSSFRSASSWFELYAAFSTFMMLLRTAINDFIPHQLRSLIVSKLELLLSDRQSKSLVTLEISNRWDGNIGPSNFLYHAAREYLPTRITNSYKALKVGRLGMHKNLVLAIDEKQEVFDEFEDIKLHWKLIQPVKDRNPKSLDNVVDRSFILSFHERHREKVMNEYIPHIFRTQEAMRAEQRIVKIHSMSSGLWKTSDLTHPATFDTLALDPELKQSIIDDLELFLERKELYKKMGKPWRRGYLLYGPPGTGKSSLIAAIAKKLRLDIYDLELGSVKSNSDLKRMISDIFHRSIIVIEDIDCIKEVQVRPKANEASIIDSDFDSDSIAKPAEVGQRFTLSALLNYMDGLWTSCGEDIRIVIFTTNHVEKLDPALLRPGRMDMHIELPFCKTEAFRILATNFGIESQHPLLKQIDEILKKIDVTPAVLGEQLLRNKDPGVALEKVIEFLKEREKGKEMVK